MAMKLRHFICTMLQQQQNAELTPYRFILEKSIFFDDISWLRIIACTREGGWWSELAGDESQTNGKGEWVE